MLFMIHWSSTPVPTACIREVAARDDRVGGNAAIAREEPRHLSCMMGPPTPTLRSEIFDTRIRRAALAPGSSVTLLACQSPSVPPTNACPLKILPSSLGIRLIRTPPVETSAVMPLVW